jgi:cobyrinic acid a,c-diamide synthase
LFWRGSEGADLSIIEGVMGLYDGKSPLENTGSTAELAELLDAPVLLVVDASAMARSTAAVVLGFQQFHRGVRIAGVIANRVGGEAHFQLVRAAVEQACRVPVIGYLTAQSRLAMPERHLGLFPALERGDLGPLFGQLADAVLQTVDLAGVQAIAEAAPPLAAPAPNIFVRAPQDASTAGAGEGDPVVIAVAQDAAFNFYYPENLELLEWFGASLRVFRPLEGEPIPEDACGVYIGGGFPEAYAGRLARNTAVLDSFRSRIAEGMPMFAECGGFMFLTQSMTDLEGQAHPMVGAIPARVTMTPQLTALGYREVTALEDNVLLERGESIRGHAFHYSTVVYDAPVPRAWQVQDAPGEPVEGVRGPAFVAGYTHLHFASNPRAAARFVAVCRRYARTRPQGARRLGG